MLPVRLHKATVNDLQSPSWDFFVTSTLLGEALFYSNFLTTIFVQSSCVATCCHLLNLLCTRESLYNCRTHSYNRWDMRGLEPPTQGSNQLSYTSHIGGVRY